MRGIADVNAGGMFVSDWQRRDLGAGLGLAAGLFAQTRRAAQVGGRLRWWGDRVGSNDWRVGLGQKRLLQDAGVERFDLSASQASLHNE